jgi:hypothetical protein
MKTFVIWLVGTLVAFGVLGGSYHLMLTGDPRKVVVIVDSSYPMTDVWPRVPKILRGLDDERYAVFSLLSEKSDVHGWQARLELGQLTPYGPRNFEKLGSGRTLPENTEAARVYFVTNAPAADLEPFDGWEIVRP